MTLTPPTYYMCSEDLLCVEHCTKEGSNEVHCPIPTLKDTLLQLGRFTQELVLHQRIKIAIHVIGTQTRENSMGGGGEGGE